MTDHSIRLTDLNIKEESHITMVAIEVDTEEIAEEISEETAEETSEAIAEEIAEVTAEAIAEDSVTEVETHTKEASHSTEEEANASNPSYFN